VLIVEDEEPLRRLLVHALGLSGFAVEEAADGPQALAVCRRLGGALAAAVVDRKLPGPDGLTTIAGLRQHAPTAPCVLMTGGSDDYTAADLEAAGVTCRIQKPFNVAELADTLRRLLASDEAPRG
jgi:two-component system response regulator FlrC